MPRVEDAHFRLLGGRLVLEWLSLAKLRDGLGIEPDGIVQGTVEFWSMVDGYGFSYARFGLESLGRPEERDCAAPAGGEYGAKASAASAAAPVVA